MKTLPALPLDTNWRYFPTEDMDAAYGSSQLDESSWGILPTLTEWPHYLLTAEGGLHLRRTVNLQPADFCTNYFLHLDAAPDNTAVYVNGWHIGTTQHGQPFEASVTDQVSLGDNLILLKVSQPGTFGKTYLQPVPCE